MISFQNPGEIDLRSILFMGVNVKEHENPIGFFGTGLKYAIAVLLRTGHKIEIWRGTERLRFSAKTESIRGKTFELIYMNDQPLGITTDLGKKWKVWQAFREIYSNMLDEHGEHKVGNHTPAAGKTTIFVDGAEFAGVYKSRGDYFLETPILENIHKVEVHSGLNTKNLFYRGVLVHESSKPFLRTYNLTAADIDLTEDRTLKNSWEITAALPYVILKSNSRPYVEACLLSEGYVESELDFMVPGTPGDVFMEVVKERRLDIKNTSARKKWMEHMGWEEEEYETVKLDAFNQRILEKAIDFCLRCGYTVNKYKIVVVKELGDQVLGMAKKDTIFIAEHNFKLGVKQVILTLFEEWVHLDKKVFDRSRKMQQFLFDEIISLCERFIYGEPI
jgi:hypothetical protein